MITRKQVAEKLGRSVATVRRLEGKRLHPKVSAQGVHLFHPDEVEEFAEEVLRTGRALPPEDQTTPIDDGGLRAELDELQEALAEVRAERDELQSECDEANARAEDADSAVQQAQKELEELREAIGSWAAQVDQGCALLLEAESGVLLQIAAEALASVLEQPPR